MFNFNQKRFTVCFLTLTMALLLMLVMMISASADEVTKTVEVNKELKLERGDLFYPATDYCGSFSQPYFGDIPGHLKQENGQEYIYGLVDVWNFETDSLIFYAETAGIYEFALTQEDVDYEYEGAQRFRTFRITVTSGNTAPTDITLSGSTVAENSAAGTTVGTLGTTDEEGGAFTYSLVTGSGDTDNGSFTIEDNVLKVNGALNYESKPSLSIRVQTKDSGNATYQEQFTVTVTDVNEPPAITSAAAASYAENGTDVVYTAAGTDPEGGSIAWSIGSTDAALFDMNAGTGALTFKSAPDYETPNDAGGDRVYDLIIAATSTGTSATEKSITVTLTDVNEAPSITSGGTADFAENGTGTVYSGSASDVDAGSVFTWSIGGTDAALFAMNASTGALTFSAAPNFESAQDADHNNVYDLTVTVSDGALTDTQDLSVTVTGVNESPIITSGAADSFAENGTGNVYTATGTDPEGDNINWSILGTDAILFNMDVSTGTLTFRAVPDYETPNDVGGDHVYDLTVIATSDGAAAAQKSLAVTVTNVNEAPSITSGETADFAENGSGTVYTGTAWDEDAGSAFISTISGTDAVLFTMDSSTGQLTFNAAPNFESAQDLDHNNVYDLTVTVSDGALTDTQNLAVTVTGVNEAPSDIALADHSVTEDSAAGTEVTVLSTQDEDAGDTFTYTLVSGTGDTDNACFTISGDQLLTAAVFNYDVKNSFSIRIRSTDGGGLFVEKAFTINVDEVNYAPTDIALSNSAVNENASVLDAVGSFSTTDANISTVFDYTLVTGAGDTDNAHFTIDSGALHFVDSPNFEGQNEYSIRVRSVDIGGLYFEKQFTITVSNVNEAPMITSASAADYAENASGTVYNATSMDEDMAATAAWSMNGGVDQGLFVIDGSTGALAFITPKDYESPASADGDNVYNVILQVSDGLLTDTLSLDVSITNVNEGPTNLTLSASTVLENTAGGTAVGLFTTTDPDAGDNFTYSLAAGAGGADNGSFTIAGNELRINSAPDYEAEISYSVLVRTADLGGLYHDQQFTITVIDANDPPVVTSPGTVNVTEGTAGVFYSAAFVDEDGDTVSWSIGGADSALFAIDTATGALRFNAAPDFEAASDFDHNNVYSIILTASDGALTDDLPLAVSVTNVNEAPVITSGIAADFSENGTGIVYTAAASDPEGDSLAYSVSGTESGLLMMNGISGALTFVNPPDYERPLDVGSNNIYNVKVSVTDGTQSVEQWIAITILDMNEAPADIQLSQSSIPESTVSGTAVGVLSAADQDAGDSAVYTLVPGEGDADNGSFSISGDMLITSTALDYYVKNSYSVRIRCTDAHGLLMEKKFFITVTEVNSVPTNLSLSNSAVPENTSKNGMVGTFSTTDRNLNDTFAYTLVPGAGDADNASFTISGNALLLNMTPDFETKNSFSIRVRSSDSGSLTFEKQFVINITDVNDAPIITSGASAVISENASGAVYTAAAQDADSTAITWSLSGADAVCFAVDASTGVVSLLAAKDYEAPADYDKNNVYELNIIVSDGSLAVEKAVSISLANVNEAPYFTSLAGTSFAEDVKGTVYQAAAVDADSDAVSFTLGGVDASKFTLDSTTGKLAFLNAPDYEWPADNGADNIYDLVITAFSKDFTVSQNLAVTVTDINEAPVITSSASVRFMEGGTGTVYTAKGSDPEGTAVIFGISGTDASKFTISRSGVLSFKEAPLYSSPADSDGNNIYNLTLTATDESADKKTTTKALAVTVTESTDKGAEVIVNDVSHSAGDMETVTETDGRTKTTVTVNEDRLSELLSQETDKPTVIIPINTGSSVASGVLTGQMVKAMEEKEASLVVKTNSATYTLPTTGINIDEVAGRLGLDGKAVKLLDITVKVEVSEPSPETVSVVESAANSGEFSIVVPAVEFSVTCTYQDTTVEVKDFDAYAERMIPVPDGVDPKKITTGITVLPDGTSYSVPTKIVIVDGRYYAVINSLTNSVYMVIWHPVEFADVAGRPDMDIINDMGSRMIVNAIDEKNNYAPDTDITSGEFIAVIIKALGLAPETGIKENETVKFSDLTVEEQYAAYLNTAVSRNLISADSAAAFEFGSAITREQAMLWIAKAMEVTKLKYTLTEEEVRQLVSLKTDASDISVDAVNGIAACLKTGVLFGEDSEAIKPKTNVTRAEAAVIVQKLLQNSGLI